VSVHRPTILALISLAAACDGAAPRSAGEAPDAAANADAGEAVIVTDAGIAEDAGDVRPELGSIGYTTWIHAEPGRRDRLGEVRPGTRVRLRSDEPIEVPPGKYGSCKSGRFYPVEPKGVVCEDETITRDLGAPLFRALALAAPREGARPYDYAFSTAAPMYGRIPTEKEQKRAERRLRPVGELVRVRRSTDGHEDLAETKPAAPTDPIPDFFAPGKDAPVPAGRRGGDVVRKQIPHGSMLSFSHAFDVEGRTFLLSPDLTFVPADRMRPFRPTTFRGVLIDAAHPLPLGWFRKAPRPRFRKDEQGALVETGERFEPRKYVGLTGQTIEEKGEIYWETREPEGAFVKARDVSVVEEPRELPSGILEGEKWIDVSLGGGTLTLFEGKRGVYSTLMSPGAGGVTGSAKATTEELVRGAFTPLGKYRIAGKYRAAQLTDEATRDPSSFWIADVPHVQYFRHPFAIHAAYWHEDFGVPKSGGCINLSPEDASFVFGWTNPRLPEGWSSVFARKDEQGTWIAIRR
jgi:hypothetical protein